MTTPQTPPNPFLHPKGTQPAPQPLDAAGSWPEAEHVWDARELDALALAHASGRPLLVRGEPGIGKSQLARAAAAALQWDFRYEVITARHEAQDLLWRYDAVERLAMANKGEPSRMQDFVTPGPLWHALNPAGAHRQAHRAWLASQGKPQDSSAQPKPPPLPQGTVVLLDEIDKADSDLPNGLLEVLANGAFSLPWGEPLLAKGEASAPTLVVLTSNEERELPIAFVRRCVCLHLTPPPDADREGFLDWLQQRAEARFPAMDAALLREAAAQVHKDRLDSPLGMGARPGLAEYLDLLRALQGIAPGDPAAQAQWLQRLSPYALRKQYPQHEHPRQDAAPRAHNLSSSKNPAA